MPNVKAEMIAIRPSLSRRPQGKPASSHGVACSLALSEVQTCSGERQHSLVLPPGAIALRREGSVPKSTSDDTANFVSRAEGKRRRHKPRKSDSGGETSRDEPADRQDVRKNPSGLIRTLGGCRNLE